MPTSANRRIASASVVGLLCAFLAVLSPAVSYAQITSGSITGSVKDTSGAVIPGATVTLVSATRGTTIETTTNENGDFTFPNAPGDTYIVRVTMDGFKTRRAAECSVDARRARGRPCADDRSRGIE